MANDKNLRLPVKISEYNSYDGSTDSDASVDVVGYSSDEATATKSNTEDISKNFDKLDHVNSACRSVNINKNSDHVDRETEIVRSSESESSFCDILDNVEIKAGTGQYNSKFQVQFDSPISKESIAVEMSEILHVPDTKERRIRKKISLGRKNRKDKNRSEERETSTDMYRSENYNEVDSIITNENRNSSDVSKNADELNMLEKTICADKMVAVEMHEIKCESKSCPFEGCKKTFGRPFRLEQHLRSHTGEMANDKNLRLPVKISEYNSYDGSTDSDASVDVVGYSSDEATASKNNTEDISKNFDKLVHVNSACRSVNINKNSDHVDRETEIVRSSESESSFCDILDNVEIKTGTSQYNSKFQVRFDSPVSKESSAVEMSEILHLPDTKERRIRKKRLGRKNRRVKNRSGERETSTDIYRSENYNEVDSIITSENRNSSDVSKNTDELNMLEKTICADKMVAVEMHEIKCESKSCPFEGCKKTFGRPFRLQQHLRSHTGERPFVCPSEGCSKSYTRQQHLKRHIETFHADKSTGEKLKCEECGKLFSNVYILKKHYQRYHILRAFTCNECGQSFKKQQHLKTHTIVHTGIKPYACEYPGCEMRFETPSKLKRHQLRHEGSRYACPQDTCQQTFDTYKDLQHHLSHLHPRVCDICNRPFKQLRQLKKHRLTHENEVEAFFCPIVACNRYYYHKRNLTVHIEEKHAQLRIYECGVCSKRLSTKQKLIHHMTTHAPSYKRSNVSKKPRKIRKDKGAIRRDLPRLLSGYTSDDDGMREEGRDDGDREDVMRDGVTEDVMRDDGDTEGVSRDDGGGIRGREDAGCTETGSGEWNNDSCKKVPCYHLKDGGDDSGGGGSVIEGCDLGVSDGCGDSGYGDGSDDGNVEIVKEMNCGAVPVDGVYLEDMEVEIELGGDARI